MRRVVIDKPGGFRHLRLETAQDLVPRPGEVADAHRAIESGTTVGKLALLTGIG